MVGRGWLCLTILACGLLASPAVVPGALDHRKGEFHVLAWLFPFCCFWLSSVAYLLVTAAIFDRSVPRWSWVVAAMMMAAIGPLAAEATQDHLRSAAAFAVSVLAVAAGLAARWWLRGPVCAVLTATLCGLDVSGLLWPLGALCSGLGRDGRRVWCISLLIAGAAGIAAGRVMGLPSVTSHSYGGVAYALHRDLLVCLPVVLLGAAGLARFRPGGLGGGAWVLSGYAAAGLTALLPAVLGLPLSVPLVVLGGWWVVPFGLADLADLVVGRRERPPVAGLVGMLVVLAVLALSWPGVRAWLNAGWLAAAIWMS